MRRSLLPLALCAAVLLAGCTGTSDTKAGEQETGGSAFDLAKAQSDSQAQHQRLESLIADCMKKQGFQYLPATGQDRRTRPAEVLNGRSSVLRPAEEVRTFRQKYGFGSVYARLVFPDDPAVALGEGEKGDGKDPNADIRTALDNARRRQYDLALTGVTNEPGPTYTPSAGCQGEAEAKIWPGGAEEQKKVQEARERASSAFQTDPAVVAAAQKYADCLREKGYRVPSRTPGEIEVSLYEQALAVEEGSVSKADAAEGLRKEIEAALADLQCRTDYATIARTKYAKAIFEAGGA